MVIRRDPWKQGKGKSQWSSRPNKRIQGTTGQSALSQPTARLCNSHWENLMATGTWTPEQDRCREVTELQGCHQRAPLLQAREVFGYPEKKVAEEMEHLWGLQWPIRQGSWWLAPKLGPPASLMDHETSSCWFWETYCLECCHLIKEYFYLRGPRAFPGVKSLQGLQQYPAQLPCTLLLALMAAKWPSHQGLPICCLVSGCHIFLYQLRTIPRSHPMTARVPWAGSVIACAQLGWVWFGRKMWGLRVFSGSTGVTWQWLMNSAST